MSRTSNLDTHRNPQEPSRPPGNPLIVGTRRIVGLGVGSLGTDPQDASDPRNPLGSLGTAPRPSILSRNGLYTAR
ncbi:hypothetical protein PGTUg99_036087 [Puccinia graminis f. sp. tritici]|uniref:Uncharacterized protein n=1 Tax=Puccinia graminis f. sp. tritici TaxID=56615 RepID=A0A5B0P6U2_PUCGR|nr:hypothetical protein PGTUg99_036087 [Puccinia graminis f. sp. tritici]